MGLGRWNAVGLQRGPTAQNALNEPGRRVCSAEHKTVRQNRSQRQPSACASCRTPSHDCLITERICYGFEPTPSRRNRWKILRSVSTPLKRDSDTSDSPLGLVEDLDRRRTIPNPESTGSSFAVATGINLALPSQEDGSGVRPSLPRPLRRKRYRSYPSPYTAFRLCDRPATPFIVLHWFSVSRAPPRPQNARRDDERMPDTPTVTYVPARVSPYSPVHTQVSWGWEIGRHDPERRLRY